MAALPRRAMLELLQAELLTQLEAVRGGEAARDAAALSRELRAVTAELESMPEAKGTKRDELAERRAERRAAAAGQ